MSDQDILEFQTVRYRCVWCKKSWGNRPGVEKHIPRCWYRPANQGCKTCVHFTPEERSVDRDDPIGPEYCGVGISLAHPYGLRNFLGNPTTEPKIGCEEWEELVA